MQEELSVPCHCLRRAPPNQSLHVTGHATDGLARHDGPSRVSRHVNWVVRPLFEIAFVEQGPLMASDILARKHCGPCEGHMKPLQREQALAFLVQVPGWAMTADDARIRREWVVKDFATGLDFFQRVGEVAEDEGHHPDLHLTSYRQVAIEIWTHAAGGLTENDFILAAKIDELPVAVKR